MTIAGSLPDSPLQQGFSPGHAGPYVAEVLCTAVGTVHKVHASDRQEGKYFQWGDPGTVIDHYPVVSDPRMGDVWPSGTHVGVFLGEYNGKLLYISARDNGDGVFVLQKTQYAHYIQIKLMPAGGTYRRSTP